jgi:hypothetical protein
VNLAMWSEFFIQYSICLWTAEHILWPARDEHCRTNGFPAFRSGKRGPALTYVPLFYQKPIPSSSLYGSPSQLRLCKGANIIEADDAQRHIGISKCRQAFTVHLLSNSVRYYCSVILTITLLALIFKAFSGEFSTSLSVDTRLTAPMLYHYLTVFLYFSGKFICFT